MLYIVFLCTGPSPCYPNRLIKKTYTYTSTSTSINLLFTRCRVIKQKGLLCLLEKITDSAFNSFIYVISSFESRNVCLMCDVIVSLCTSTENSLIGSFKYTRNSNRVLKLIHKVLFIWRRCLANWLRGIEYTYNVGIQF